MPQSDCFVSVIAPLYNDADIVDAYVDEVIDVLKGAYANYELVLVDDGSTDATVERVGVLLRKHACIRLIRLSRQFGQQTAISAGLDSVIGDFAVIMIPETDPPELICEMVEKCRNGAGVVFGVRSHRPSGSFLLRIGTRAFYWLLNYHLGVNLPANTGDFRVLSRQALNASTAIKDRLRYLRIFSMRVGYGTESVVYDPIKRRPKPRTKSLGEALRLAIDMIVVNSEHPLRLAALLALGLSLLSCLHIGYVVLVYLFVEDVVPGWATQSLHSSVMFLALFLTLAIQSEYIGKLSKETRMATPYFVLEEQNSSVLIADEDRKNVVTESRIE